MTPVSRATRFWSTNWRVATAVNSLVMEAVSNRTSREFLILQVRLAYPNALANSGTSPWVIKTTPENASSASRT
jgi:hypothetical protein